MDAVIIKKNKWYKAINTTPAKDVNLSLKAKGLMFYFLSKPEGWRGQVWDVVENTTDGRKSVQSALKELADRGYVVLVKENVHGKLSSHYKIFDEPSV